ncbi:thaumatin family protein [Streptomyces sp. NPDC050743]|uniref:thaumatin family protein n=1 Tax=Streptomyces sp. NPDC050743 TaxID=3365634 RepID=UPI00379DAAF9
MGSAVNADGSKNLDKLPILEPGQSATVTVPETTAPGYWRGKFFVRMGCTGTPGSNFHCTVGDCGNFADHCAKDTGEQPASLAEFNFDSKDAVAPWYDVSYVNAFSVPITIAPQNVSPGAGRCDTVGCANSLLPNCPAGNLTRWRTASRCCAPIPTGTPRPPTATWSPPIARRPMGGPGRTRSQATR